MPRPTARSGRFRPSPDRGFELPATLSEECVAAGALAADGFAEAVAGIRDTHAVIARRVFGALGAGAEPVARTHDGIARLAYAAARSGGRLLCDAGGRVAAVAVGPDAESLERSPGARVARGALSGVWGDVLAERGNRLAVEMAVRVGGVDLELTVASIARAFPAAGPRVTVFLHGLCETEDAWWLHADRSPTYGRRLRDELGHTPVYVRYNSGLPVAENGRSLAALLGELDRCWPVPIEQIALIGHSMGGLLARSACHAAAGAGWVAKVRHIVMLGTPHTGAPLERGTRTLESALARVPETRPLARALGHRSAGIKDCGDGRLSDQAGPVAYLEGANHRFVAASLAREHDHPLGRHVGDLLVLHGSAWGGWRRSMRLPFGTDSYRHVGGASHFSLLNHPAIAEQLVTWLARWP